MFRKTRYEKLGEPGQIGQLKIKNRIVKPGQSMHYAEDDGSVSDRNLSFHESIAKGGGTLPKDLDLDSVVLLDASNNDGNAFEWEMLSKPENSLALLQSPILSITRLGPLDVVGVYLVKLWINRNQHNQQTRTLVLNAPAAISPLPLPEDPLFDSGGRVRNFSFELPGPLAGWAAYWTLVDDADILDSPRAGVSRGRCEPTNFQTSSGDHAMVLGDDKSSETPFLIGEEFSVSQEIDFTNMNILEITLKFIDR